AAGIHRQGVAGERAQAVGDRVPTRALVGAVPHAAARGRYVEDFRIGGVRDDLAGAAGIDLVVVAAVVLDVCARGPDVDEDAARYRCGELDGPVVVALLERRLEDAPARRGVGLAAP